jgi:glycosyltransferase involved in cell wall biosynthesis
MSRAKRKIALVANQNEIFFRLRMPWIKLLQQNGYEVFAVVPSGDWDEQIKSSGATLVDWRLSRSGRNLFSEARSIWGLSRIFRRLNVDIVQNFHTKPNVYAPIAARLAGVPICVSTVTGLGYTFVERSGYGKKIAQTVNLKLLSIANRMATEVMFQNPDDLDLLRTNGAIQDNKGAFYPGGSGIDVDDYNPNIRDSEQSKNIREELGISHDAFVALFVGRLQLDKGLVEFIEAAKLIREKRSDIAMVMVGAPDPGNKRSISEEQFNQWKNEGHAILTGRREDVPALMAAANTVVTPTFYREGLPRTLLEAAATGLPLIGTDMPGVREAIDDGKNGILIPTKDPVSLADAIVRLADDTQLASTMGDASLERAKNEFDHRKVVGKYLELYDSLLGSPG